MGKPSVKKKKSVESRSASESGSRHGKTGLPNPTRTFDQDTSVFVEMSIELKEEGNKQFQKREYEAAILTYEKAVKLLPKNHIDVVHLRCNLATCYMQMKPGDYHRAIKECNLALEVAPRCSKALLKRAKCYEALNKLEWALKDVDLVLSVEPNNLTAIDISERIRKELEKQGSKLDGQLSNPVPEPVVLREKEKPKKKKSHKAVDKVVVEENIIGTVKEVPKRTVKLALGEDIRRAEVPYNCNILELREIVLERFPNMSGVLIKYKDKEGDLMTISRTEELRWAEESADPQGSIRLHVVEVPPEQDPLYLEGVKRASEIGKLEKKTSALLENVDIDKHAEKMPVHIEHWIVQFSQLFRNYIGFESDEYLDLHELGMKFYSEALEDAVTSEEAQELFDIAENKFQEMSAIALFNWGNVHMSRARKMLFLSEDASTEAVLSQVKVAYEWAQREYVKAGRRYEEALRIKPDFYEGFLALGQQQFEQAKLSWYFALGNKVDLQTWPSTEVLELFNSAEDNIERGAERWGEMEEHRQKNLSKTDKEKELLQKMGLGHLFRGLSNEEATEQADNIRSQINLLWGSMLYERSVIEFKLGIPIWNECLEAAVQKFELAGASPTDIAVMIKNHCSDETAQDGLVFKIDEIVQAWNEVYDVNKWRNDVLSFRMEPLLRRRVPKLHSVFESLSIS